MANSRAGTRKYKMSLGYLVVKESEEELSRAETEREEESRERGVKGEKRRVPGSRSNLVARRP